MPRTTINLPAELKDKAERLARARGVSLDELVRGVLEKSLSSPKKPRRKDPFFTDEAVHDGPGPGDTAKNHDKYLYEEES